MEKPGYVNKQHRKGWLAVTAILSCFLIAYWFIKNNNFYMTSGSTSVKGVLYKSATGTPVEGAIVMIAEGSHEHPDIAAQSDENGFYLPDIQIPGTYTCLLYTSPSPRDRQKSRMPSSA